MGGWRVPGRAPQERHAARLQAGAAARSKHPQCFFRPQPSPSPCCQCLANNLAVPLLGTTPDRCANATSLESVHDKLHVTIGGPSGWMSDPTTASFDPIFFLREWCLAVQRILGAGWAARGHPG